MNGILKRGFLVVCVLSVGLVTWVGSGLADAPKPEQADKQTVQGLYIDAVEALKWVNDKKAIIIDVRTPEEFVFVGNAGIAPNIPIQVWKGEFGRKNGHPEPKMTENGNFVKEVKSRFKTDDTIILLCRSGQRSATAANAMAKEGFNKVYSVVDGFEGDKAKDGPNKGKRTVNGWKNAGNPWTYSLSEELIWTPAK